MASAMRVFRKFRSSDGRIKVATLSSVSALVAAIALLVGVLPVFASHGTSAVDPDPIQYGGGSGACDFVESAADNELHINNPASGTFRGPDGTEISITVTGNLFRFDVVTPGIAVYDVVVNGGAHNLHYDYDGSEDGAVKSAEDLHAPTKNNGAPHNLSHINICYDLDTQFECGVTETREPNDGGVFTIVKVTIFGNSVQGCEDKLGAFTVDNDTESENPDPSVLINFGTGNDVVAGMATFTKDFGQPPVFEGLKYQLTESDPLVDVEWCALREKVDPDPQDPDAPFDGDEFDTLLGEDDYPSLDGVQDAHTGTLGSAIACKVYEAEDASGVQFTVVYFEFEDPRFR